MIEPTVFFEPYRAVLQVLQNFNYETFPMLNYFLGFMKDRQPPTYITAKPASYTVFHGLGREMSTVADITKFEKWPDFEQMGLDKKQYEALQVAITSRIALVQGPPGTGKTFLAIQILRTLLGNQQRWQSDDIRNQRLRSVLETIKSNDNCDWHYRNKIFWNKYGKEWVDNRTPIVIICFTVTELIDFKYTI